MLPIMWFLKDAGKQQAWGGGGKVLLLQPQPQQSPGELDKNSGSGNVTFLKALWNNYPAGPGKMKRWKRALEMNRDIEMKLLKVKSARIPSLG